MATKKTKKVEKQEKETEMDLRNLIESDEPTEVKEKRVATTARRSADVSAKSEAKYGVMTYSIAYVRSQPSQKSGRSVMILDKDTRLELLSEDEDGWTRVRTLEHPIVQGYIKTAYIEKEKSAS